MTDAGSRETAIVNPDAIPLETAVSASLGLWDRLRLELGETAVVTGGHQWSRLAALVATWYGAVPVLFVSDEVLSMPPGVTRVELAGSDQARALGALMHHRPGVAAAELSGHAEAVDLLLEALPAASRLMLAGTARERLTIDYYVNVHRKGLHLLSAAFDDAGPEVESTGISERARRLLERPDRAAACRAALTPVRPERTR